MRISFESKGDFNGITSWLDKVSKQNPSVAVNQIAREGERALAAGTPKDTGETASGWFAEVTTKGNTSEIAWKNRAHPESSVNVAKLIETGHGTRTGGYVPPRPYIKQSVGKVLESAGDKIYKELSK